MDLRATNRNYPGGTKIVIKFFLPSWAIGAQQNKAKHNNWLHLAKSRTLTQIVDRRPLATEPSRKADNPPKPTSLASEKTTVDESRGGQME